MAKRRHRGGDDAAERPDGGLPAFNSTAPGYFGGLNTVGSCCGEGRHRGGDDVVEPQLSLLGLTDFNGTLYFSAGDASAGDALWRSDGTEAGTTMVKDLGPGSSIVPPNPTSTGTLYFTASLGPGSFPNEVWRSDGAGAGTTLIKQTQGGIFRFYRHQGEDRSTSRRRRALAKQRHPARNDHR